MSDTVIKVTVEGVAGSGKSTVAKIIALALGSTPGCEVILNDDGMLFTPRDVDVSEKEGAEVLGGKKVDIVTVATRRVRQIGSGG